MVLPPTSERYSFSTVPGAAERTLVPLGAMISIASCRREPLLRESL